MLNRRVSRLIVIAVGLCGQVFLDCCFTAIAADAAPGQGTQANPESYVPDSDAGLSLLSLPAVQRESKLTPEQSEDVDAILAAVPMMRGEYRRPAQLHSTQNRDKASQGPYSGRRWFQGAA